MELTYSNIKTWFESKKYRFKTRPFEINLLGIRNGYTATNAWDDMLVVAYKDNDSEKVLVFKNYTTDPGYYFLKTKLLNPKGCAFLPEGNYPNMFTVGMHLNKYEALVQYRPVTVYRDNDKDNELEQLATDTGMFGINFHHGYNSALVFNNSAGCQVLKSPTDLNTVLNIAKIQEHLYGKGIDYTLTNNKEILQ